MDASSPLIITGMHRSGTSLLAGFFHRSGIHLGDELMGAKPSNPYGHFEDVEILEFHTAILQRDFGHSLWVPMPRKAWVLPALTAADRARAEALVAHRKGKARAWGWKEPRTCLFLDLWHELLPNAHFLFVVRHPRLVLDSLGRRNNTRAYHIWLHNRFLRAWLLYNRECLRFHLENPRRCVFVYLEEMLQSPQALIAYLSQWLRMPLDLQVFQSLYDPEVLADRPAQIRLVSPILYRRCLALYRQMPGTGPHAALGTGSHARSFAPSRRRLKTGPGPESAQRAGATGPGGEEIP
jgi:hypothetical protein